jgi:YegS C-terminal NAD kinase beta sandwich-like domain
VTAAGERVSLRRGEHWGRPQPLPPGTVLCEDDAQIRAVVREAMEQGRTVPPVGLLGGDLWRTLGAPGAGRERLAAGSGVQARVDVVELAVDGRLDWFVAHLLARGKGRAGWWHGRIVAVMNAEFMGPWSVAPRSHPGDGRIEVLEADLGPADRWRARRRLRHGMHVPHPDISVRRVDHAVLDLGGLHLWLDGVRQGPAPQILLKVMPSALTVVI